MAEPSQELLNVYDAEVVVVGAQPRKQAKASGLAVGAVNALILNRQGQVLLQRRPPDKENGDLWDKSVGGHVSAGEEFDQTVVREAAEELFDDPAGSRVRLARSDEEFGALLASLDLEHNVLLRRLAFQKNLRDVRRTPQGGVANVLYHIAIYAGRTEIPREGFHPQASEIADLSWVEPAEVDRLLLQGALPPNMSFLWLTQARALLQRFGPPR